MLREVEVDREVIVYRDKPIEVVKEVLVDKIVEVIKEVRREIACRTPSLPSLPSLPFPPILAPKTARPVRYSRLFLSGLFFYVLDFASIFKSFDILNVLMASQGYIVI